MRKGQRNVVPKGEIMGRTNAKAAGSRIFLIVAAVILCMMCRVPLGFSKPANTVIRVGSASALPGDAHVPIHVSVSRVAFVASTDLVLAYDPTVLTPIQVETPLLTPFAINIDEARGSISVLTIDPMGAPLLKDDIILAAVFSVNSAAIPGCYPLVLGDIDGELDFEQLVPPVPPSTVSWTAKDGEFCVLGEMPPNCGDGIVQRREGEECEPPASHVAGSRYCDDNCQIYRGPKP
jgi:hypothetical protein